MASALWRRAENPVAARGHPRDDHGDRRHAAPLVSFSGCRHLVAKARHPLHLRRPGALMRFILVLLQAILAGAAVAQEPLPPPLADIGSALSGQQPVPPALGAYLKTWLEPAEPFRIVGPLYYVGTKGLAAYLITTPAGHILLDGGIPDSAEAIEDSIHRRGFDQLKSGGKIDPVYGTRPPFYFPEVTAERVLKDWDVLTLSDIKMTALLGAGHTRGATPWVTTIEDDGRSYNVVFPCCTSVNPLYRLAVRPSYPGIVDDFRRTFRMLESMKPDIWLPAHTQVPGFAEKLARADKDGVQGWVD